MKVRDITSTPILTEVVVLLLLTENPNWHLNSKFFLERRGNASKAKCCFSIRRCHKNAKKNLRFLFLITKKGIAGYTLTSSFAR